MLDGPQLLQTLQPLYHLKDSVALAAPSCPDAPDSFQHELMICKPSLQIYSQLLKHFQYESTEGSATSELSPFTLINSFFLEGMDCLQLMAKDVPSFLKQLQSKQPTLVEDEDSAEDAPGDGKGLTDYGNWEGYSLLVRLGEQWGGRRSRFRSVKSKKE